MTIANAATFASHGDWRRVVPAAREAIAEEPDNAMAHALLALGLSHLEQPAEAVEAGRRAIGLAPEFAFAHYALGAALLEHSDVTAAEQAAREALRLSPDSDEHALLAQVYIRQRRWRDALEVAERGLNVDAEHQGCAHARSLALSSMGRREEAMTGVDEMLEADPDDAFAHASRGWLMLRQSRVDDALASFQAALRLDPTMEWARVGIVEGMKARYGVYRLFLRYSLWAGSLTSRTQWLLIIGLFVGSRVARGVLRENPGLWPILGPLIGAYILFVFASWVADPLSNLLLRLHPIGRLALTRIERLFATIVGGCLATAVVAGLLFLATGASYWVTLAMQSVFMLIPVGAATKAYGTPAWPRIAAGALLITALGLAAVVTAMIGNPLSGTLAVLFLVACFLFPWVANYLLLKSG